MKINDINRLFPVFSLTPILQNAVFEMQNNTKAPFPLIVSSALGMMSLVAQGLIDVQLPYGQVRPVSLFLIAIADSGERKTTCDQLFTRVIRDFENSYRQGEDEAMTLYEADMVVWKLKLKALKQEILKLEKEALMLSELKDELNDHMLKQPVRPKRLSLLLRDVTKEAIAWRLHREWPSTGLFSDEGGQILNGRAAESLTLFNELHSGGDLIVDRREQESFTVKGARLTLSVQVQPKTFEKFLKTRGELARDNGLLARCLLCFPASTQGARENWSIEPAKWPHFERFQKRMTKILEMAQSAAKDPGFQRPVLELTPNAKNLWVSFSNYIERNLNPGGMYFNVRDAASKTAEHAARMAAIFHLFEGRTGDIQYDSVSQAIQICEWYLGEFKCIFSPSPPIPEDQLDAMALDAWMRNNCQMGNCSIWKKTYLLQSGPNQLRNKLRLDPAIDILINARNIGIFKVQNNKTLWITFLYLSPPYQAVPDYPPTFQSQLFCPPILFELNPLL